jgi:hypothetical protein
LTGIIARKFGAIQSGIAFFRSARRKERSETNLMASKRSEYGAGRGAVSCFDFW